MNGLAEETIAADEASVTAQFIAFLVEGMTEATDRLLQVVTASTATHTPDHRAAVASRVTLHRWSRTSGTIAAGR